MELSGLIIVKNKVVKVLVQLYVYTYFAALEIGNFSETFFVRE